MVDVLARNWGLVALRGVAGILFGLLLLLRPLAGLATLVLFFSAYSLADGSLTAVSAVANRGDEPRWVPLLVSGLLGIVIGIVAFFWPGVTAAALLYLVAAWAVVAGLGEILAAIRLRKVIAGEWMLLLAGSLSVAFGVLLAAFPGAGVLALVIWIGAASVVLGALVLGLAFRLRRWGRSRPGAGAEREGSVAGD